MSKSRICPIMARGWLSSGYAARTREISNTWAYDNLPKCVEEDCALWGHVLKRLEKCCRLGITDG